MAIRLVKKKITQTNSNIKLEFLKYPSNTTSFIARLVSNLSPQHSHVHRHKLTHAAWPLYWLSLKIKTLPSPQTCLSPLPSFRQEAEKEGGTVTLDATDCSNGSTPLSTRTFVTPAYQCQGTKTCHFRSIHSAFQICKQGILQQLGSWLKEQVFGWVSQV